jgi:tetratricopeptide (TPR) repeat protein
MTNLPKDGRSQEIGRLAGRALGIKLPTSWIEKELDGDSDFGIDYFIQLKSSDHFVGYSFFLQLKGTTVPRYSSDKEYISYDFKVKTLQLYHQQEPLVMVAVVDLKEHEDKLWECPIYYVWLDEDWFTENQSKMNNQETISIKIPTIKLLDPSLDIYDFYAGRIDEKFAVEDLKKGIKYNERPVVESIKIIAEAIVEKPDLLKYIEERPDAPWLQNPEGTIANKLKNCSESLSSNRLALAVRTLSSLEQDKDSFTANELAEFYYQRASLYLLEGRHELSSEQFKLANEADGKDRYQLGYLESKIQLDCITSDQEIEEIIGSIGNESYQKCVLKSKCLALLGREQEALDLLQEHYPEKIIAKMAIFTIAGMGDELEQIIDENRERQFDTEREVFHFNSLTTRRFFFKATDKSVQDSKILPIQGKESYDLELMKDALFFSKKAWSSAKELGYPSGIIMLLDVSILIHGYFDKINELRKHLEAILLERPAHQDLIRPYSRVLFDQGEYLRVIELIENIEILDATDCAINLLSYYHLGKKPKTLELIKRDQEILLSDINHNTSMIFCIAVEIASELFDQQLSEEYEDLVKGFPDGKARLAINKCISLCNSDPAKKNEYTQELYIDYLALGRPIVIAEQLIMYLDAYKLASAQQVIELGEQLLTRSELTKFGYIHLAQAFLTTGCWSKAQALAEKIIEKGIELPRWKLILAASYQHQGKIGIAYEAIKEVVENLDVTKDQQLFYVDLCLSLGLFENVIEVVKELIGNMSTRDEKIYFLKILISIYSSNSDYPNELEHAVNRYGELVDQNNCEQEGQYLIYYLTIPKTGKDEEKTKNFQVRLTSYTQKFPQSSVLRQGAVNLDSSSDSIIQSMNEFIGITDEQVALWEKNKRSIRNGSLPVPFSIRGLFISGTRDIFTTWVYSLNYPDEYIEYRIKHAPQLSESKFNNALKESKTVLLEETTLLVLSELELLDVFLDNIPNFSIIKSVFDNINQSTHQLGGAIYNLVPKKIMKALQKYLDKLILLNIDGKNHIANYSNALKSKNVLLLTEDLDLHNYLKSINGEITSGNVFNVIEFLSKIGHLNDDQLYHQVSKACELGLFNPNMRMDFLTQTFQHYLGVVNGVEYNETGFKSIFNKLFEINKKSDTCFQLFFLMLDEVRVNMDIHAITLLSLFKGFLIRHPVKDLSSLIALYFVVISMKTIPGPSSLIVRSEAHTYLWGQYKEIMARIIGEGINEDILVRNVVKELFNLKEKDRIIATKAIKSSFVPLTQEADAFDRGYQEFAYNESLVNLLN